MQSKEEIKRALFSSNNDNSDNSSLIQHEKDIVDQAILDFKEIITDDMVNNKWLKRIFFTISCAILLLLTITIIVMVYSFFAYKLPNDNAPSFAAEIIAVMGSFVTAFMVLPKVIAKHLFGSTMHETFTKMIEFHENHKY